MNRLSKIFRPTHKIPKLAVQKNIDITSKSQRLMLELGIIKLASPGCFHFLPLGLRALKKLENIVNKEMYTIGAEEVVMPTLTNATLWEKSGRFHKYPELFILTDRHNNQYILSPTHEEAITDLLASVSPLSYRNFPLRLYQITSKYRDEMKPRFGLLRGKQFLMKDLYTFDIDLTTAGTTYTTICESYESIFRTIGINAVKVDGATGNIGGHYSHEFHYIADIGEDKLLTCLVCDYKGNIEIIGNEICPRCKSNKVDIKTGIEIGHTFLLGDKYSKPLNATYLAKNGKPENLQMGCYGLGVSRILGAALEVLSLNQELRWPFVLAPFKIVIIPPKKGSKEESLTEGLDGEIYRELDNLDNYKDNVVIDDRRQMTIGKRYLEARQVGYPYVIAIGATATQDPPLFEINEILTNKQYFLDKNELLTYFKKIQ